MTYEQHPLSAAFPAMPTADYEELVQDIIKNGLLQPVVLFEGQVLDGWHRYQAALDAIVKPTFRQYTGDNPVAYVLGMNLHRRHLTGSQRAAAVVACSEWAPPGKLGSKGAPGAPFATNEELAQAAGVGETTIHHAKRAHEAGLGDAVRDGKVTAKEAAAVAKLPEEERQAALEAPPAPKPKPAPKPAPAEETVESLKARVEELEEELETTRDHWYETQSENKRLTEENERMLRVFHADPRIGQALEEVKKAVQSALIIKARNDALMIEVKESDGYSTMWKRKFENLEKELKSLRTPVV